MAAKDIATRILITAKDEASSVFTSLQRHAGKIATAIAGYFSIKMFGRAVEEAEALDVQMRKLEGVIGATGGAAGLTAQEIDEMARRLDEATTGSATGFRDAAAQLLTFKSVGKDSFETVLMLAQDLADAGFGSVTTNAVQLGKALEDPVRGMNALARSGVSFSQEQERVIKSLVETGRAAEAQQMILEAVAGQVGGTAQALGGGLTGALDLVNKRFTDLKEQLGAAVLPVFQNFNERLAELYKRLTDSGAVRTFGETIASAFNAASEAFFKFFDSFDVDAVIGRLKAWASTTKETVEQWGQYLATASDVAATAFNAIATGFNTLKTGSLMLAASIAQSLSALTGMYARLLEMISGVIPQMRQSAEEWRSVSDAFGESARQNFDRATEAADRTQESFFRTTEALGDLLGLEQQAAAQTANTAAAIERTGQTAELTADQLDALGEGMEYVAGEAQQAATGIRAVGDAAGDSVDDLEASVEAAAALEQAFKDLGVVSQRSLDDAAEKARVAFETISRSGQASAREIEQAFRVYAERATAANQGVVSASLKAKGAMLGLKVEADETGKVIVRSMTEAASATGSVGDAADSSAESVRNLREEVERLNDVQGGGDKPAPGDERKKFDSPFARVFNRAEQVGGLALKERLQQIYDQFALTRSKIGTTSSGARDFFEILARLQKEVDDAQREKEAAGALYGSGRQQPAAEPQPGGTYNVSINIGSRRQTVRTASQGDAERLIEMLRELERAASVSP